MPKPAAMRHRLVLDNAKRHDEQEGQSHLPFAESQDRQRPGQLVVP